MTALNEIFCMSVMFVLGQVTAQLLMRNAQVVDTRYIFFFKALLGVPLVIYNINL